MDYELSQLWITPKLKKHSEKEVYIGIPRACSERFLNEDDKQTYNEHKSWSQNLADDVPIWSRLKFFNCLGLERPQLVDQDNHYEVEVPGRLLSLWGNTSIYTEISQRVERSSGFQTMNNVLALCACLKLDISRWSALMLDEIARTSSKTYRLFYRDRSINNDDYDITNLNSVLLNFEDTVFQVRIQQAAVGAIFMPFRVNEFNLARALKWFFKHYQFGLLKCQRRCIAFGFAVDTEQGYFMYDCQSVGMPLFEPFKANSYVLRTNHLQILLYCLIVALNVVTDNVKFTIYSAFVNIIDPKISRPKSTAAKKHIHTKANSHPNNRINRNSGTKKKQSRLSIIAERDHRDPKSKMSNQKAEHCKNQIKQTSSQTSTECGNRNSGTKKKRAACRLLRRETIATPKVK